MEKCALLNVKMHVQFEMFRIHTSFGGCSMNVAKETQGKSYLTQPSKAKAYIPRESISSIFF